MRSLVLIYLAAFFGNGLLAVAGNWPVAGNVLGGLAWVMAGASVVVFSLLACLPALPKWRLLPAIGWSIWSTVCGGFPLAFVIPESADAWLTWGQIGLGGVLLGAELWMRRFPRPLSRGFSGWNFFRMGLVAALLLPVVLVSASINAGGRMLEAATGGYVKLRPAGVMLEEREFERDGRRVRLVAMMHIGDADFYKRIHASLPSGKGGVILLEGVTDERGLLQSRFSYANLARGLGLTPQESSDLQRGGAGALPAGEPAKGGYRHADVDVSAFQPRTIAFLNAVGRLLGSASLAAALEVIREPDSPFREPGSEAAVQRDVVDFRNAHLAGEIESALRESSLIVVPWGAMHLPFVEDYLMKRGFRETRRESRAVIRWRGSAAAAVGR